MKFQYSGVGLLRRATNSGNSLTEDQASIIKGMLLRGDRQHDIAAWFGVNGGRIGEISKGRKFLAVTPQAENLPRPGPYMSGQVSESLINEFRRLRSKAQGIFENSDLDSYSHMLAASMLDQIETVLNDQLP